MYCLGIVLNVACKILIYLNTAMSNTGNVMVKAAEVASLLPSLFKRCDSLPRTWTGTS